MPGIFVNPVTLMERGASPLPLIHLEGDKFIIGEEAANSLRNITHNVAVVSIAGLYRYNSYFNL
jgi:hypothetical protein